MKKPLKITDLPKGNIFQIPENYFAALPENIAQKIALQEGIRLADIPKESVFQIPANYFEELPLDIQQKVAMLNGLNWAEISKESVFQIPANYFEELPKLIQLKIKSLQSIADLPKENIFSVPNDFFESLTDKIQQKISSENVELARISKENIFTTPANFFEELPHKIQKKLWAKESKFESVWASLFAKRYGWALASLSLVILLGIFWFNQMKNADKQELISKNKSDKPSKEIPIAKNQKDSNKSESIDNQLINKESAKINEPKNLVAKNQNQEKTPEKWTIAQISRQDILTYLEIEDLHHEDFIDLLHDSQMASTDDLLFALDSEDDASLDVLGNLNEMEFDQLKKLLSEEKEEK